MDKKRFTFVSFLHIHNNTKNTRMKKTLFFMALTIAVATTATAQIHYPKTHKDGTVDEYFGTKVADPYRWLENDTSAQTAQWVAEENKVTDAYLSKLPLRGKLLKRLTELSNYEKQGAPIKKHGKYYFYRNNGLQNQYVLYTTDKPGNPSRVFFDPNTLSDDGTVAVSGSSFSNDGKYFAYTISRSGSDWQEIYVMDVETGRLLDDHILWSKFSVPAWQGDGFYYSAYDAPVAGKELSNVNEGQKVYYHKIGTPQSDDVLFYENPVRPKSFYGLSVNEEETMSFLVESGRNNGNTIFVRNLKQPNSQFIQMTPDAEYYYSVVATLGSKIYIITNDHAPRWRLMAADIKSPGFNNWKELVAEGDNVLTSADLIGGKWILTYSKDASSHAYVYDIDGNMQHEVTLPDMGDVSFSGQKDDKECYYSFETFTVPQSVYKYDIDADKSVLSFTPKLKCDTKTLESKQVFFTSKDGTRVPMTLIYKKGLKLNGDNPTLLYGYGGFNISMTPYFSNTRIPFLERGGIFVQANLRGGAEYGEQWHEAGTKMKKQNVFDDFIAAAEYLIKEKYTRKERLAIMGGSNGGLLVGACMTQRPDLFQVAIPEVGVMDMLRYHLFTIGWNWASDYGTSADSKEMFEYLHRYSPLHNIKPGTVYPATLVTTADHDDRVVPAHSFKFAARLQECHSGSAPVLIRIDTKSGHGAGKPLAKQLEEQAIIYSFILENMGIRK